MEKNSPKTKMPIRTAVKGSKAPIMAAGVEPTHCIAFVVSISENTVGTQASIIAQNHAAGVGGSIGKSSVTRLATTKNNSQKQSTKKVSFKAPIFI